MSSYRIATVAEMIGSRPGLVRVRLDDGSRAHGLTQLTGSVAPGDEVVVNTTAVDLGLGTGGWHVIHWNLSADPFSEKGPGHLMKLRYTSLQVDAGAGTEHHPDLPSELDGTPVIVAGLHSQVPIVTAAIDHARPGTKVGYVMTDGGALPIALSDVVQQLRELELLAGTVTAGHAFGGDIEALNVPSGLALARHLLDAEVIVVAMGPGVAGTNSRLGFTGLEVAPALDAAAWLGGRPIMCLRWSDADERDRHRGVSHHSATVLDAVRSAVEVPVPAGHTPVAIPDRHRIASVDVGDVRSILDRHRLAIRTMGRGIDADRGFFDVSAASGFHAAAILDRAGEEEAR